MKWLELLKWLKLNDAEVTIKFKDGELLELHNVIRAAHNGIDMILEVKDGTRYSFHYESIKYYKVSLENKDDDNTPDAPKESWLEKISKEPTTGW